LGRGFNPRPHHGSHRSSTLNPRRARGRYRTLNRGCSTRFSLLPMREFATLFQAASPAVLTTYRKDGTAVTSPVWFRFQGDSFEVVIAENDVKLRHLAARPECELLVFETVPPFRGMRVRSDQPILTRDGAQQARQEIAARYLGEERGRGSPPNAPAPASYCASRRITRRPGTSTRSSVLTTAVRPPRGRGCPEVGPSAITNGEVARVSSVSQKAPDSPSIPSTIGRGQRAHSHKPPRALALLRPSITSPRAKGQQIASLCRACRVDRRRHALSAR
jgi:hypothetical protein